MSDRDRAYLHLDLYRCPDNRRKVAVVLNDYELQAEGGGRGVHYHSAVHDRGDRAGHGRRDRRQAHRGRAPLLVGHMKEPEFGGLGNLVAYTPRLGRFNGKCTDGGCVVLDWGRVHSILADLPGPLVTPGSATRTGQMIT